MSEQSVTGIVLRRTDSGESDRRLTLLTKEFGKIDVLAKGARKSASRLSGSTEPMSVAVFCLAAGKKNRFVTQAQPLSALRGLRTDFDRLSLSFALVELFSSVVPYDEPSETTYELLLKSLEEIERRAKPISALVWAETALLELSGVLPMFERCVVCDVLDCRGEGFLSPIAGGNVCDEHGRAYSDRFPARHEVRIALARITDLESPPENLKFADLCLQTLLEFFRHFAERPLPANDSLVRSLHHERLTENAAHEVSA